MSEHYSKQIITAMQAGQDFGEYIGPKFGEIGHDAKVIRLAQQIDSLLDCCAAAPNDRNAKDNMIACFIGEFDQMCKICGILRPPKLKFINENSDHSGSYTDDCIIINTHIWDKPEWKEAAQQALFHNFAHFLVDRLCRYVKVEPGTRMATALAELTGPYYQFVEFKQRFKDHGNPNNVKDLIAHGRAVAAYQMQPQEVLANAAATIATAALRQNKQVTLDASAASY